jgi:membrane protease YdiL (CAAX protease family)
LYLDNGLNQPLQSISHYYYTRVSSIFVAILSILATFLIIYKGKDPIDFYISLAAGLFALCVVFFPTGNITEICCDASKNYSVTYLKVSAFREGFHYASAGIFLGCLAYMSLFLFTKSNKTPQSRGSKKIIRNRIYRVCGILMIAAIVVIVAGYFELIPKTFYVNNQITFWMETVAVESFGFSWLIKGETMLKDE